jgi:hypothetical protein
MQRIELSLFADYYQFYLQDEKAKGDLSDSWNPEATQNLMALAPGTIGIGTARNMTVPVVIEILDRDPGLNLDGWDQINECSIDVPSGKLVVAGCTDYYPDAKRIAVTPGTYRARLLYKNLDQLSDDGLEGDDAYVVLLWPGPTIPARIVKARA